MVYYANCNLSPSQRDQWSLSFSSLPAPGYDCCLGWSMLGLGLASSERVPAPQNAQVEFAGIPSTETYNLDMTKDYWCPYTNSDVKPCHLPPACTHPANQCNMKPLATTSYLTPMSIGSPTDPMYPEHQHTGVDESGRQHTGIRSPWWRIRKMSSPPVSPKSHPDCSSPPQIRPELMPKRRSSRDSTASQRRLSTSSGHSDGDQNIRMLRKKAHNQVEKRYRANLNAGFRKLEDVIKQDCATSVTDSKMAKGSKPSRKVLILHHAYEYIVALQAELRLLQKRLGEKQDCT
ncbi:hypothetical protein ETB97_008566 [Aspergillus alliaceus]|uniref:BHLH domain-containing protein n=1 Tax=Petromyces alliaceus TaxID=209559 RepID=A0A8H5ZV56_PETAA|nr:hypothetical protein ETB97_008566 [Aspergillus burnettii]